MTSPLTGGDILLEKELLTSDIVKSYKQAFNYDVSYLFTGIESIKLYKCLNSGYRFFYPFTISGDSKFYEYLQKYDWYYMPWKWEHKQVANLLKPNMNVLEVGCAKGDFLRRVKEENQVNVVGLELNESVFFINTDFPILNEMIQEHAIKHNGKYDIVCSFQVLEHISDVKSFIEAQVITLKKGGRLIISVPNNDSFTKFDMENDILNMPPHHMGLWNRDSLKTIQTQFKLNIDGIKYEPLQLYHLGWYINIFEKRFIRNFDLAYKIYLKLKGRYFLWLILRIFKKYIKGHTILVIYSKK